MKKIIFLFSFFLSFSLFAQDTTIIQTLTFDSTGRSYVFDFPVDAGQSYEKIIMEYRIRCTDGLVSTGSNTNLGCGEWDYSCNTFILDSNYTDSVKSSQADYIISGFNGDSYNYTTIPTYNYYRSTQEEIVYSDTLSELNAAIGSGNETITYPFDNSTGQAKVQYLLMALELTDGGLSDGDITGLKVDLDALGAGLNNLRISMKATEENSLDTLIPQLEGFTNVYYLNTSFSATGMHQFNFSNAFDWDGISNVIVEFSFDQSMGTSSSVLSESIEDLGLAAIDNDYSMNFNGVESVTLDNPFTSVENEVTISLWAYGNEAVLPSNTTAFEGIDSENRRQVNVHLPWSNGRVYWDCGNDGSGYDRIDKEATTEDIEGKWNHWAFTKNATTGSMRIYLNGSLWHSAGAKTRAIDLESLHIGSSANLALGYYGKIDEFRVWNKALSQSEIEDYMYRSIPASHPSIDNLVAYYNFNEGIGDAVSDLAGDHNGTALNNPLWRKKKGAELFMQFELLNERPNLVLVQGEYTSSINENVVLDSLINAPNSIKAYSVIGTDLNLDSIVYYYESGDMPVFDENGDIVDYVSVDSEGSIEISTLNYYSKYVSKFEIMSFVTPYGINLDLGMNGKMWQFDVTDFAPILKDSKRLSVEFGNYQEDMDIRFLFISGTPPRDVMNLQQVWRAGAQRPYAKILSDDFFEPRDIQLDSDASTYKLRAAITGHGQEGEFIPRNHFIDIDGGSNEFAWQVWKECADNPIFPQGGTWIYDRAGWCPGAPTDLEEFALDNEPGDIIEVDYGLTNASGTSNYLVNIQLVTYGEANHTIDAGLVEVIRPSNRIEYDRMNPICYDPIIVIQNTGSTNLTSLTITYEVEGGQSEEYEWTGDLAFMEKEEVTLPIPDQSFWAGNANSLFNVYLSNPNGDTDEYAQNNSLSTPFTPTEIFDTDIYIKLKTNNFAYQNSYTIKDIDGNVVFTKDDLENTTTYRDTMDLPAGCYTFELEDTGDNGLYFWANSAQGSGYVRIVSVQTGQTLKSFEREFGKNIEYAFTLSTAVSIIEVEMEESFDIYPNPAKDQFFVDLELNEHTDISILIHDISGRLIEKRDLSNFRNGSLTFDLSDESNGVYYCTLISNNNKETKMLVLNK